MPEASAPLEETTASTTPVRWRGGVAHWVLVVVVAMAAGVLAISAVDVGGTVGPGRVTVHAG